MKKSNVLWGLVLLMVLGSCEKESLPQAESVKSQQVRFFSVVEDEALTRAGGSSWAAGDHIGIYMKKESMDLNPDAIVNGADNISFVTAKNDGYFRPASGTLEYPTDGSAVDFIAYYPYQSTINSYIYKVDVTNQAKPENIDLLYADNLTGRTADSPTGNLQFYHKLSSLVMNISSSDGTDFSGLTASISGVKTKADFNLTNGQLTVDEASVGTIAMRRAGNAAEAILLPVATTSGIEITLRLGGKTHKFALPNTIKSLDSGKKYVFAVTVKGGGLPIVPDEATGYAKWRETPVITKTMMDKANVHYLNHYMPDKPTARNYSLLYDSDLRMAYWVAYPIYNGCVGTFQRQDNWIPDPELSSSLQANFKKAGDMYSRDYNRGHQIPSKDRTGNGAMNATTFYYTNATPQNKDMNGDIWGDLEAAVRGWGSNVDTVFVVTGAMARNTESEAVEYEVDAAGNDVAVPKYYYKAIARKLGGVFYTIAFKIPNDGTVSKENYMNYARSVSTLEKETGFTFFPSISADIKATLNTSQWR